MRPPAAALLALAVALAPALLLACSDDTTSATSDVADTASDTAACLPIEITSQTATDGCTVVVLRPECWGGPIYSAWLANGNDPLYQLHNPGHVAAGFYFNVELYTAYGAGWTGDAGTFDADCEANGLCIYLVPDNVDAYLATAGQVEITALPAAGTTGTDLSADVTVRDLRLQPVPGTSGTGCYHVDSVRMQR